MRYAQDMIEGRWKEDTCELIKVSKRGVLLDGQHRLLAVVKSNKPIYFHVGYDLPDDVFDVLDTGSIRNASDTFLIKGIKHQNAIPSMINIYTALKNGYSILPQKNYRPTNSILLELYYKDEVFWQGVSTKALSWYQSFAKILSPSTMGGLYALLSEINEHDADRFFSQLATGLNIENISINLLRQKLMQDKMAPRKMTATLRHALIIKAWNCFRKNEEIKVLKFDMVRDKFPKPL